MESWTDAFLITGLLCLHWIQTGRTALVLGISCNLFGCTFKEISKEHTDALPLTNNLTEAHGITLKHTEAQWNCRLSKSTSICAVRLVS